MLVHIVNNEEKTVLTNCQLLDILQKEFSIDTASKTDLEIDIYMNILKRFLKTWPRWDEFDKLIKESKMDPTKTVDSILAEECKGLKSYLEQILKLTEGQMAPILDKLEKNKEKQQIQEKEKEKDKEEGEVVMEVACSRAQLNELVYRHPVSDTIFYISEGPRTISLKTFSLTEILNWPNIYVTISLPWLECYRKNSSHFDRVLKNLKLPIANAKVENLSKEIYWKNYQAKKRAVKKVSIVNLFNELSEYIRMQEMKQHLEQKRQEILEVLSQFRHDFVQGPDLIALGAEYQFFLNRYKYIRYLSKEPPNSNSKDRDNIYGATIAKHGIEGNSFDLRLEEIISPAQKFQVTRVKSDYSPNSNPFELTDEDLKYFWDSNNNWLKIECCWCEKTKIAVEEEGVDSWIASKDKEFFRLGIQTVPERWKKVVASDGQYFN
ncbi:hypothetical protein EVAR_85459_1 [Eumeta japonica]|uniref:Uncharacterized protein n=1 Tax=Eumeta variegata TaxID=151549 RepID=A0A4C1VD52_EUMVA|nr:hypothetical protein EVAR_85459_1 [Eumeta japonica]